MAKQPEKRLAVALKYDPPQDEAPRLTAKGAGANADRIIALAKQHGVPIREDRNLVQILATLELNQEIPPQVYAAVAEVLAFVYRVGRRVPSTS